MMTVAPATGRGAQAGSGGVLSTGQTGPAIATPPIPVSGPAAAAGQASSGTAGPTSDTTETVPSGLTA